MPVERDDATGGRDENTLESALKSTLARPSGAVSWSAGS